MQYFRRSWVEAICANCKYYSPNMWNCMYRCIPTWGERKACKEYEEVKYGT